MADTSISRSSAATVPTELRSVGIALAVIEELALVDELGPSELARRLDVAKSTVHRTCRVLADAGLLERTDVGRHRLGLRLVELGRIAVLRSPVGDHAIDVLADLRAACGETVQVGVADGAEVVYLERVEGNRALRVPPDDRRRAPVHRSSIGKVLAAFVPGVLEARLAAGLPASTGYTIVVPGVLRDELAKVRERGWAASTDETEVGMSSLAVPVRVGERVVAAMSMVGPTARITGSGRFENLRLLERASDGLGLSIEEGRYELPGERSSV